MAFASIHIPDFLVQAVLRIEARADPDIRRRPLALVDGGPPLENVVATNEAAARAGIALGMTKSQAAQFCAAAIRRRSRAQEKTAHGALLDLGWSISPCVEDTAPSTIVLDLAGLASLFGSEEKIARQLAQRASDFGLDARVAVAAHPEAALHAARGFPGITVIAAGEESQRLGSLPVGVLEPPLEILDTLERWGVRTCATLAALPVLDLSERLGQVGVRLHEAARGAGVRSLVWAQPDLRMEEVMPLESAVSELEPLAFLLGRLLDQLCARLAARALAARAIHVFFDMEASAGTDTENDNEVPRRRGRMPGGRAAARNSAPHTYEKILCLPVPMRDPKMLLRLLRLQLQSDPPAAPILKIVLAADPARPRVAQGGLFLPPSPDPEKLELTIAHLANLVGEANVGSPQLTDTHRPGAFRMRWFLAPRDAPQIRAAAKHAAPATGFRLFRPPLPATVGLSAGRPVRISIRGRRGDVVAASGPWRTSGDWWQDDRWEHDEWDLEIRFDAPALASGRHSQRSRHAQRLPAERPAPPLELPPHALYCVYYDAILGGWFVRGAYD
jgi:protein ImuB